MTVAPPALRELLLAAQVLDDVDLVIDDGGVTLCGPVPVPVRWSALLAAVGGAPAGSERARTRLVSWMRLRSAIAAMPLALLAESVRPIGLPRGHVLHPGRDWPRLRVLGGVLEVGPGIIGLLPERPDECVIVASSLWRSARLDPGMWWPECMALLDRMGALAATRWARDPEGLLRPMGDCDVMTLLGSPVLRAGLAGGDGGMRAAVVPMRRRGWTHLSRLDPAFAPAAAAATAPEERGFCRPVLVTADEIVLAGEGGSAEISLRDGVTERWTTGARR